MKLAVNENNEIISFTRIGGLPDAVDFDDNKVPSDFDYNFKSSFYLLKDGEIVKNPNYATPQLPVIGLSEQDKINAQIMLNQAEQQAEQDKFNAQILLKLAGGIK
ncbi:DUF2977 domain-containing protein [Pediococcus acidilactici]|uniref:DUF2977 domain-containing protein n=1 Tax=Pediococcus acidilactici TaxID=1254 RepID=UPI002F269227